MKNEKNDALSREIDAALSGVNLQDMDAPSAGKRGGRSTVRGTIAGISGDDVFVDLGPRMQGVVSLREFDTAPAEGTVIVPYVMALVNKGPNAANAKKVLDHLMSNEGQAVWANAYLRPVRPSAISKEAEARFLPAAEYARAKTVDYGKMAEAQKAFILKQGEEGTQVAEICRKAGISQATYFNWKKKYAGLLPTEMRRLRELEEENGRLKKIVADLTLDREMLQDIVRRKL